MNKVPIEKQMNKKNFFNIKSLKIVILKLIIANNVLANDQTGIEQFFNKKLIQISTFIYINKNECKIKKGEVYLINNYRELAVNKNLNNDKPVVKIKICNKIRLRIQPTSIDTTNLINDKFWKVCTIDRFELSNNQKINDSIINTGTLINGIYYKKTPTAFTIYEYLDPINLKYICHIPFLQKTIIGDIAWEVKSRLKRRYILQEKIQFKYFPEFYFKTRDNTYLTVGDQINKGQFLGINYKSY